MWKNEEKLSNCWIIDTGERQQGESVQRLEACDSGHGAVRMGAGFDHPDAPAHTNQRVYLHYEGSLYLSAASEQEQRRDVSSIRSEGASET